MDFKPKVPAARKKQQPLQAVKVKKERKIRVKNEVAQVASGPFALGPSVGGSSRTIVASTSRDIPVAVSSATMSSLPMMVDSSSEDSDSIKPDASTVQNQDNLVLLQMPLNLPTNEIQGKCGKWFRLKSGRLIIELNGIRYNADQHTSAIIQTVGCIDDAFTELSNCRKKMVLTPDLNSLLY